jgi:hypothetical protein
MQFWHTLTQLHPEGAGPLGASVKGDLNKSRGWSGVVGDCRQAGAKNA